MLNPLPIWRTASDDDLIDAFKAEVALALEAQPRRNCAVFEVAYRALALRENLPFQAFDGQYRRLLIKWLRKTSQAEIAVARMDGGVDDLVTEVYMRVFNVWRHTSPEDFYQKFDGQSAKVFSYLHTTCCSVVISTARRARSDALPLDDEIAMSSYTPDEWLNNRINVQQRIEQLLNQEEQTILSLYLYGCSINDIANRIGKHVNYTRRKLKEILRTLQADPILRDLSDGTSQ